MNLFKSESDRYTEEHLSARGAQRLAEYIAWGPVIFQVSRLMVKFGILETLRDSMDGLTLQEIQQKVKSDSLQGEQHAASLQGEQQGASLPGMQLSEYALKILLEASLSAGTVLIDKATDKYTLSKTGWFSCEHRLQSRRELSWYVLSRRGAQGGQACGTEDPRRLAYHLRGTVKT